MIRRLLWVLSAFFLIASVLLWIGSQRGNPRFAIHNHSKRVVQVVAARRGLLYFNRHSSLESFVNRPSWATGWHWKGDSRYVLLYPGIGHFSIMTIGPTDGHDYAYHLPIYVFVLVFGAYPATSLVLLVVRKVERRRTMVDRRRRGLCEKCGYDLTGNTSGICPECGRETGQGRRDVDDSEGVKVKTCEGENVKK
jgi:hypothetical protein